jgi:hypothetical protein
MRGRAPIIVGVLSLLVLAPGPGAAAPPDPSPEAIRAAAEKALPLLQKGAVEYTRKRDCFSCHNQGVPMVAMKLAGERGFAVEVEALSRLAKFTEADLRGALESYRQGRGQGGTTTRAGYALWALDTAGWPPDEVTTAVAGFLLQAGGGQDTWRPQANRPPSEASSFTSTYVSLRALQRYAAPEQKEQAAARTEKARRWLIQTAAKDTEDRVFRLWSLHLAGAPEADVQAAARQLRETQREDGGWAQLDDLQSDAYATGSALVSLQRTGSLDTEDSAYQRGLRFLIGTQEADGSWHVASRSQPFQTYFESGFPHGKDQFISAAATAWATAALVLACPTPSREETR